VNLKPFEKNSDIAPIQHKPMGKIILITGASSGIGEAIALHLASKGHTVYGTSRKAREDKSGIHFIQLDVDDEASVQSGVKKVLSQENRIDVVINCAGMGILGAVEEIPVESARRVMETNLFGVMRMCQAVLPAMRKQRSGAIINISSIIGEIGLPFRGLYAASKFAVEGMSEALRMEVAPFGVRVVIVQPGGFRTNIAEHRPETDLGSASPYEHFLKHIKAMVYEEVEEAPTPEKVGFVVEKILRKNHPTIRYKAARFMEILPTILKKLIPYKLYEYLIMNFHKMHDKKFLK
jgi:NAD(P)-dependent dehydrogenase (short-subunit alcohol dehydrogenase family)